MQEKTNLINDGGTMEKKFELLTFDELLKLPIDIESCFDPVFDPPIYLLEEWRKMREKENPFHGCVERKIGNTWYVIETECVGNEPLAGKVRRLIFSDKEAV